MPLNYSTLSILVVGAIVLYIIMWIFAKPIKFAIKILLNGVLGCGAMFGYNFLVSSLGIAIGINTYTALTCAFLGIPGFVFLILTKIFIS